MSSAFHFGMPLHIDLFYRLAKFKCLTLLASHLGVFNRHCRLKQLS
jgi:hypothetical protein